MAKVVPMGQPANDPERQAIAYLRDKLPDGYTILHNFEIVRGAEIYEIDLAILTPHGVYVVDVKGTRGLIDIYGVKWYPEGRQPYHSPLAKLRQHAKVLKSLISDTHTEKPDLRKIHVHAAVLMTAPDAQVVDHGGLDGSDVVYLNKCVPYFQSKAHIPDERLNDIRPLLSTIEGVIRGKSRPRSAPPTFRDWRVEEKLGGDDRYTEYRAQNIFIGKRAGTARLRIYRVDPYQDQESRDAERKRVSNSFRAVAHMPGHPNILTVRDFFGTEDGDLLILVTEDFPGQALSQYIKKPSLALTFDQKIGIIRETLSALEHAHLNGVVHRNITPDAILVSADAHARLASFDYARVGESRSSTIAQDIINELDTVYQAPECYRDPARASAASDLFSVGLVFYELLAGERAFDSAEQIFDNSAVFPVKLSELKPDLPAGLDGWLQRLCAFDPHARFEGASVALHELNSVVAPDMTEVQTLISSLRKTLSSPQDFNSLPRDYVLANRFIIHERLGKPGGFGVVYKVYDTIGDIERVLKLITRDPYSVYERLRQEYVTLLHLPKHRHVVEVVWADRLPDDTPYIVFEYIQGWDVEKLRNDQALSMEDAVTIARQAAEGLAHLHRNNVYHLDIKPSNLLWTERGVRIIDFNVAESDTFEATTTGGTRRYLPPDYDFSREATPSDKADRDLYALGLTLYECLTGSYPFDESYPPVSKHPRDPREIPGGEDLSPSVVGLVMKLLSPRRGNRFTSAEELVTALSAVGPATMPKAHASVVIETAPLHPLTAPHIPNYNPFVSHLLTLYSQSKYTNAGTRGLDEIGELTYVPTLLDVELLPAVLAGEFGLVIVTGNAGDGKTAFVQKLEGHAQREGAEIARSTNGASFTFRGRTFLTNHDGSQDEGDKINDQVLLDFFGPFAGASEAGWPTDQTRLIAVNEGRLIDFLSDNEGSFSRLGSVVREGLRGLPSQAGVAVVNLNLRSVVADRTGGETSIFDRLIRRMTNPIFWEACGNCELRDRCYAYHNARTLMDPVAGPKVIERLKTLHTLTHLRGRLHITMRDLRSALAYMLVGTKDCDEMHKLYQSGSDEALQAISDGYYFNAWMGGSQGSEDRLISMLREVDIGETSNPDLDRSFEFLGPQELELLRFSFDGRGGYDNELFRKVFDDLPRDHSAKLTAQRFVPHKNYVAMLRRRHFFERRDDGWRQMLPYHSASRFLFLVRDGLDIDAEVDGILLAINRGEGLRDATKVADKLAMRVRQVEKGTIRSYRLFDRLAFSLVRPHAGGSSRFLEYLPQHLILLYSTSTGHRAELNINLDVYEMLTRLNEGYRPSVEERQGFYRSLVTFKNVLGSAPYQEVLLTETGHEFYRISKDKLGALTIEPLQGRSSDGHQGTR